MTPEATKYLREVWGYERIEDIDDETMVCIAENVLESREHNMGWYLDETTWEEFCQLFPERAATIDYKWLHRRLPREPIGE